MTRRATAAVVVLLLLVAGAVTVFVVSREEDDPFVRYCDEVEAQQQPLTDALSSGGSTGLIEALPSFRALAAEAPEDIADEWAVVVDRVQRLVDALEAAGVDPVTYDRKHPPQDLDKEDRAAIDAAASALADRQMVTAISNVQQQARDVCKTPLSL